MGEDGEGGRAAASRSDMVELSRCFSCFVESRKIDLGGGKDRGVRPVGVLSASPQHIVLSSFLDNMHLYTLIYYITNMTYQPIKSYP